MKQKYKIKKVGEELYILSDEEIKEGDWFVHTSHKIKVLRQAKSVVKGSQGSVITTEGDACWYINCKKIIATTDKCLLTKELIL